MKEKIFTKLFDTSIDLNVASQNLSQKGRIVYEYNPFRNYRLSEDKYFYKNKYYTLEELKINFHLVPNKDKNQWILEGTQKVINNDTPKLYEKGLLVDFITDEFLFSINHPVTLLPQPSYDGSVNLIINDGINNPKLINSRFSTTGLNTYEIIDRKGNIDTNIYDSGIQFNIDTSLYKQISKIPKLKFVGTSAGGNLKVGNYHFYFKYSDGDNNETDFVAESGLVSVFIGFGDPRSISSGTFNENSNKLVRFILSGIDESYNYVIVYYSRDSAEGDNHPETKYVKLDKKFPVDNNYISDILITGYEDEKEVTAADINLLYNVVDSAKASTTCLNMLFLGNVHKPNIPYKELLRLSLYFFPYLKLEVYKVDMSPDYFMYSNDKGYYDSLFIYNNTGYWGNELYRFGIVYILPNNELSPVFNIRGRENVGEYDENQYTSYKLDKNGKIPEVLYDELTGYVLKIEDESTNLGAFENVKGVVSFKPTKDVNTIYAVDIRTSKEVITELKQYVKGYFFVRLKRIPTILAQGLTIGVDLESHTPTLPVLGGVIDEIKNNLSSTYVESENIQDIHYISEGFLSRFNYRLKRKSIGFWKKFGMVFSITAFITGSFIVGGILAAGCSAAIVSNNASSHSTGAERLNHFKLSLIDRTSAEASITKMENKPKTLLVGRNKLIPKGMERSENASSRSLKGSFLERIILKEKKYNKIQAILCPDYEVNLATFNQIFTGNDHIIRPTMAQNINNFQGDYYLSSEGRHFYVPAYLNINPIGKLYKTKIIGVPDNTKIISINNYKFRSRAGEAEEASKYEYVGNVYINHKDIILNSDIIRGSFGPYIAMDDYSGKAAETVEILIPGYDSTHIHDYILLRMNDKSAYSSISDRYSIDYTPNQYEIVTNLEQNYRWLLHRGDCYLCQVTHRLNRNFNDPTAPYNDKIVDPDTWKNNFNPDKAENEANINLGDLNAVKLGMWVTFRIRSSNNLNIRTLDHSQIEEKAMSGHPRGFYPQLPMSTEGSFKMPDSGIYNKGFSTSLSSRWNFETPDVPYIKNWFGTRIMYSDIHINDSFKNGFRIFQGTHYRDYSRLYGEITKLITLLDNILCIFEHGVALIPVNERAVAGNGAGGNIYINTSNVLPENPKIISDVFGSQWPDSILKAPGKTGDSVLYVYGVDTVAKKIWRTDGNILQCLSDFKVLEFLNNNITLSEFELSPIVGLRNVKTCYNAFKRDVLFTFYDNTYGHEQEDKGYEEKVWNLCWNEVLEKFITFYSWVPSYMENIDNIPFSFDRNTSKWIALLGLNHAKSSFADGLTITNVLIHDNDLSTKYVVDDITGYEELEGYKFIGVLELTSSIYPNLDDKCSITYELEPDIWKNYEDFKINNNILFCKNIDRIKTNKTPVTYINICATIKREESNIGTYRSTIALTSDSHLKELTTDFWKHGLAGIIDIADDIKPTYWYGKQHKFEFEFIVVNDPAIHKIFTNLEIVSNKAQPESFHYEVIGDAYDFAKDKPNMYFRLEALKALWQYNGSDVVYNKNFLKIPLRQLPKSADLIHTYYSRYSDFNNIEDLYAEITNPADKNYAHLSGGEIIYYPNRLEFRVCNHVRAISIDDLLDTTNMWNKQGITSEDIDYNKVNSYSGGRSIIGANCQYLEDRWNVQITPLLVCYKNEYSRKNLQTVLILPDNSNWLDSNLNYKIPPLSIYNSPIPTKILETGSLKYPIGNENLSIIRNNALYNLYKDINQDTWVNVIDDTKWLNDSSIYNTNFGEALNRKELDMRDKFIKIRIRYSGENLAVIDFINTVYRISNA